MLKPKNPMLTTTLSVLVFEAIVFGLAIPGIVLVEGTSAGVAALWCGLAIGLALVGAALLRKPAGWPFAWAAQVVGVLLGLLTPMMWFVGGIFALLFTACVVLGRRLESAGRVG